MSESIAATPSVAAREHARRARRQALLHAAESVFSERGFAGATMAEIASRTGYSAGNLYNMFTNKEAMFVEVLSAGAGRLFEQVSGALRGDHSLEQALDRFIDAILSFVQQHRGFFVLLMQASPDFDWHAQPVEENPVREQLDQEVRGLFERALARREIRDVDPRTCTFLVQGTLNSYIAHWVRTGGPPEELWARADPLRLLLRRGLGIQT